MHSKHLGQSLLGYQSKVVTDSKIFYLCRRPAPKSSWRSIKALCETTWSGAQYAYFDL